MQENLKTVQSLYFPKKKRCIIIIVIGNIPSSHLNEEELQKSKVIVKFLASPVRLNQSTKVY